jgi:multiple sugar transport system substrate-binding protein
MGAVFMLLKKNEFQVRYDHFLQDLRSEISSGKLKPGEYILPENTLRDIYGLSRVSIRKALAELVVDGLIEKIAGKGNRVKLPDGHRVTEVVKLGWFSNSYEIDIVRMIIERYEASYPFVKVELELIPEDDYARTLTRRIEQDQGPDIFIVSDIHVRELIDSGNTNLLTGYVQADLHPETDSYPQVFNLFSYQGKMLAAPFIFSPVMICYNQTHFSENDIPEENPVKTWDELLRVADACTKELNANGMIEQYGFCFSASPNRWPVFILQNGGGVMAADRSHSIFSNEANVEALEFCVELMYNHQVSPIYSHGSNYLAEYLFMKQRVAMILTTYYFMNEFRDHPIVWDVLPVPEQKKKATLLLGGGLAVNARSEKQKVAESLVDFMTGQEAQSLLKKHGCTIPMLKVVAEDDSLLNPAIHPAHYNRFTEMMPYAYSLRELNLRQQEIKVMNEELNLLWANMEKPLDSCMRVEMALNEFLHRDEISSAITP